MGSQILDVIKPLENYNELFYKYYDKFYKTVYESDAAIFISAHDTNIMGLLSIMFDVNVLMNDNYYIPNFSSSLIFEVVNIKFNLLNYLLNNEKNHH